MSERDGDIICQLCAAVQGQVVDSTSHGNTTFRHGGSCDTSLLAGHNGGYAPSRTLSPHLRTIFNSNNAVTTAAEKSEKLLGSLREMEGGNRGLAMPLGMFTRYIRAYDYTHSLMIPRSTTPVHRPALIVAIVYHHLRSSSSPSTQENYPILTAKALYESTEQQTASLRDDIADFITWGKKAITNQIPPGVTVGDIRYNLFMFMENLPLDSKLSREPRLKDNPDGDRYFLEKRVHYVVGAAKHSSTEVFTHFGAPFPLHTLLKPPGRCYRLIWRIRWR